MRNSASSRKQEFMEKWLKGLQIYSSTKKNMSILERKRAIKITADVAMASSRNGSTVWSRALLATASSQQDDDGSTKNLLEEILGGSSREKSIMPLMRNNYNNNKRVRSKRVLKRSHIARRARRKMIMMERNSDEEVVAKKKLMMKRRSQVLKRLVPGGEHLGDDVSLIRETLDYIASLRVQVDVMRSTLANASSLHHCPPRI